MHLHDCPAVRLPLLVPLHRFFPCFDCSPPPALVLFPLQVKGLQSEYTRMVDSGAAAGKAAAPAGGELPAGEVAEMRKLLADLEEQNSRLQVGRAGGWRGGGWRLLACSLAVKVKSGAYARIVPLRTNV